MIASIKTRTPILALILFVFVIGYTYAARVVVVPLGAESGQGAFSVFVGGDHRNELSSTVVPVRWVTVMAPTDGNVIVNSTLVGQINGTGKIECSLSTGSTLDSNYQQWLYHKGVGSERHNSQISATRGFTISKGETVKYSLNCSGSSDWSVYVYDSSMTAIFTPSA